LTLPSELLAFCAVAVVFSLAPGPGTVPVGNRTLGHRRRMALVTALGKPVSLGFT
jgi:threonine/homoserine/homoserine lactone efflux protein